MSREEVYLRHLIHHNLLLPSCHRCYQIVSSRRRCGKVVLELMSCPNQQAWVGGTSGIWPYSCLSLSRHPVCLIWLSNHFVTSTKEIAWEIWCRNRLLCIHSREEDELLNWVIIFKLQSLLNGKSTTLWTEWKGAISVTINSFSKTENCNGLSGLHWMQVFVLFLKALPLFHNAIELRAVLTTYT